MNLYYGHFEILIFAPNTIVNYALAVLIVILSKKRSPITLVWVSAIAVRVGWVTVAITINFHQWKTKAKIK